MISSTKRFSPWLGAALALFFCINTAFADDVVPKSEKQFGHYYHTNGLTYPVGGATDNPFAPPMENPYFFTRLDAQPFYLNIDMSANWTDALNRTDYHLWWWGYNWSPFPTEMLPGRIQTNMASWKNYDEENSFRIGNSAARILERYSGFDP